MGKYIVDKLFSAEVAIFSITVLFMVGVYSLAAMGDAKDARQDTMIVELVKSGTPLPEARCAVRGC